MPTVKELGSSIDSVERPRRERDAPATVTNTNRSAGCGQTPRVLNERCHKSERWITPPPSPRWWEGEVRDVDPSRLSSSEELLDSS